MIIVFGSIYMNFDMSVKRFPEDGEASLSMSYTALPGGKAANQSLGAARVGAKTALVGRVGDDGTGLRILQNLKRNGVMTSGVAKCTEFPTGIATIVNDKAGGRRTLLALGANSLIDAEQAPADIFRKDNVLLTQLEIPLEQNAIVMKAAHDKGATVVLNASPVAAIPMSLLSLVDYLIIDQAQVLKFAAKLKLDSNKDVGDVIDTLVKKANLTCIVYDKDGGAMAKLPNGKELKIKPNKPIHMIDRSGADDCFCGTFTAYLHEGKLMTEALKAAATAFAIVCSDKGDEASYPYLDDLKERMKDYGEVIAN